MTARKKNKIVNFGAISAFLPNHCEKIHFHPIVITMDGLLHTKRDLKKLPLSENKKTRNLANIASDGESG